MSGVSPRVNSSQLGQYLGKRVTLVGKILQSTGTLLVLETSDGGQVQVQRSRTPEMVTASVVEVIGQVQPDLSVQEMTLTNFAENFDLPTYDRMLHAATRHQQIFV